MAADNVVVEPGDMLLLHTGFATEVLRWNRNPDPVKIHTLCTYLDARDESLLSGSATRRSRRWWRTTTPSRAWSARIATRAGTPSCRSTTCACSGSASRSAKCGTCTSWRLAARHDRSRFLLTAPPLRLPGIVGSPLTPVATV